jgi:hypothetical protein
MLRTAARIEAAKLGRSRNYFAMSLSSFNARTLTLLQAGLAGRSISSPGLNGFGTPFWAGRAGIFFFSLV